MPTPDKMVLAAKFNPMGVSFFFWAMVILLWVWITVVPLIAIVANCRGNAVENRDDAGRDQPKRSGNDVAANVHQHLNRVFHEIRHGVFPADHVEERVAENQEKQHGNPERFEYSELYYRLLIVKKRQRFIIARLIGFVNLYCKICLIYVKIV